MKTRRNETLTINCNSCGRSILVSKCGALGDVMICYQCKNPIGGLKALLAYIIENVAWPKGKDETD